MDLVPTLKNYAKESSIHGLPHIADTSKHPFERICWTFVCLLAGYATLLSLSFSWNKYVNKAVSFIVDTDYLSWNPQFPSVTICEMENHAAISKAAEKIYGPDRNLNIEMFVRQIAYFDGVCKTCLSHCRESLNCSGDMKYITNMARKSCSDLIEDCIWNDKPFDCCSEFLPLKTEIGPCLTINSANAVSKSPKKLNFNLNRTVGGVSLKFSARDQLYVYIHSRNDVPTLNHPKTEKVTVYKKDLRILFMMYEVVNDPALRQLSVKQRECLFPDETKLKPYSLYSYSGCLVDCRVKSHIRLCNCTHHFIPEIDGVATCTVEGLACLSNHSEFFRNMNCDCPSSCIDVEFNVVSIGEGDEDVQLPRRISVDIDRFPTKRFKRIVISTKLDLVVGMGSALGLFMGASLLSLVELLYFLLFRRHQRR